MTIWADADSLQSELRGLLEKRALREATREAGPRFRLVHVASRRLAVPRGVEFILVEAGPDAADAFIEGEAKMGDLAVTRDIPLAERLAMKGIVVLNDRGESYTYDTARERRSLRDAAQRLRALGLAPESPRRRNWGAKELKAFADAFDRELQKYLRAAASAEGPAAASMATDRVQGVAGDGGAGAVPPGEGSEI